MKQTKELGLEPTYVYHNKLKAIAAALAKIDGSTMAERARQLGISRTTLWRWAKKANVQKELETHIDSELQRLKLAIVQQLAQRAIGGNLKAIRLFFELTGGGIGIGGRVRQLIDDGVTPAVYADWYRQITSAKNYPTS